MGKDGATMQPLLLSKSRAKQGGAAVWNDQGQGKINAYLLFKMCSGTSAPTTGRKTRAKKGGFLRVKADFGIGNRCKLR